MNLFAVEQLRVSFGALRALDGVSYSVPAGRTLGIVGERGAGKTLAVLAPLGVTAATLGGRASFAGEELSGPVLRRVRGSEIGAVPAGGGAALNRFHRLGRQLGEAVRAHRDVSPGAARDRAVDILELVGVPDPHRRVDRYPHELSAELQQRALIAVALVNEPRLLILDDPTRGLDITVQAELLTLLADLRRRLELTVIITSRDPAVAAELADEICVLRGGRIVQRATPGPAAR